MGELVWSTSRYYWTVSSGHNVALKVIFSFQLGMYSDNMQWLQKRPDDVTIINTFICYHVTQEVTIVDNPCEWVCPIIWQLELRVNERSVRHRYWKCWMSEIYWKDAHSLVVVYWFWFLHRYLLFIYVVLLKDTQQMCKKDTWFIIYFEILNTMMLIFWSKRKPLNWCHILTCLWTKWII